MAAAVRGWAAAILVAAAAGCGFGAEEPNAFLEAAAVMPYFDVEQGERYSYHAGPYQGGSAVRGPDGDAWWVKDGQGYVVNEKARELAPELPQAPEGIVYDGAFEKAVGYTPPAPAAP